MCVCVCVREIDTNIGWCPLPILPAQRFVEKEIPHFDSFSNEATHHRCFSNSTKYILYLVSRFGISVPIELSLCSCMMYISGIHVIFASLPIAIGKQFSITDEKQICPSRFYIFYLKPVSISSFLSHVLFFKKILAFLEYHSFQLLQLLQMPYTRYKRYTVRRGDSLIRYFN